MCYVGRCGLVLFLLAACAPSDRVARIDGSRTNVLLLTLCTVRADHLGAYGYERGTSPHLDALARQGVLFEKVLTASPWTRPSIASSITGLYPRSLAIEEPDHVSNDRVLDDSFETLAETLHAAGYYTIGLTGNPNSNAVFRFDQGYDFYRDTGPSSWQGYANQRLTAEVLSQELLDHLREHAAGRKFFAHLVWVDAHQPLLQQAEAQTADGWQAKWKAIEGAYDQQILYMDHVLGELLAALRAQSGDDLLVVVTADHGEAFRHHHRNDSLHGMELYNSTLWVPLIVHHPSLAAAPRRVAGAVEVVDIAPTLLGLLGIEHSQGRFEGYSLEAAVASGQAPPTRSLHVVETAFESALKSAIFQDGFKLVVDYHAGPEPRFELYETDVDPTEQRNLAADEPERVVVLYDRLRAWQEAHAPRVAASRAQVSVTEQEQLRALGYHQDTP